MGPLLVSVWLAGCSGSGVATTAAEIMTRAGCNQDRALQNRSAFVYHQKLLVRLHRVNGKLTREERREYTVSPTAGGYDRSLTRFEGKYATHGKLVAYDKPGFEYKGVDIGGVVVDSLASDLTGDSDSKDGIAKDLFPLVTKEQQGYVYRIVDKEDYRGKPAWRIAFEPKAVPKGEEGDKGDWKGEALIDATEYQPIWVSTKLAWKVPMMVRILLGTNVEGLGFSVSYQKFADGVWFPVSYGGEFHVRAVFFYARNMSISLQNLDFQRADVSTSIRFADAEAGAAKQTSVVAKTTN